MLLSKRVMNFLVQGPYGRWCEKIYHQAGLDHDLGRMKNHCRKQLNLLLLAVPAVFVSWVILKKAAFLVALIAVYGIFKKDVDVLKKAKKRQNAFRREVPLLVTQSMIYLEAGYSMELALRRAVKNTQEGLLEKMFKEAFNRIDRGSDREEVFHFLVESSANPYLSRMVFLVNQGIRIGSDQVMPGLARLGKQCWQEQMDEVRMGSEKASSKMVFPMLLIFLAISLLALGPGMLELISSL